MGPKPDLSAEGKAQIVVLRVQDLSALMIANIVKRSMSTVTSYLCKYKQGGAKIPSGLSKLSTEINQSDRQ